MLVKSQIFALEASLFLKMTFIIFLLIIQNSNAHTLPNNDLSEKNLVPYKSENNVFNVNESKDLLLNSILNSRKDHFDKGNLDKTTLAAIQSDNDDDDNTNSFGLNTDRKMRKPHRNIKYLADPDVGPLQRKSAKKRFKIDRNLQRLEKKSWNMPTQTMGHYLDIKDQAKQAQRKAYELTKLLNSFNEI